MKIIYAVLISVITIAVLAFLYAFPLMWLWNWLMPILFELPEISFWQSLGIGMLSGFLFKNTGSKSEN